MQNLKKAIKNAIKIDKATMNWIRAVIIVSTIIFLCLLAYKVALWTNSITFESHPLIQVEKTGIGFAIIVNKPIVIRAVYAMKPITQTIIKEVDKCEWSKECVEAYIDMIGGDNQLFISWAKYTSAHEGGYRDQFSQANFNDRHENGKIGSFGQFQFGEDTYKANCEVSTNWKMDWRAQVRCAKKLFEQGSYQSHWVINTQGWLGSLGE